MVRCDAALRDTHRLVKDLIGDARYLAMEDGRGEVTVPGTPVGLYVRAIGAEDQARDDLGLQLALMRGWAAREGHVVLKTWQDVTPENTPLEQRPGLAAALEFIRENPGVIHALVFTNDNASLDKVAMNAALELLLERRCGFMAAAIRTEEDSATRSLEGGGETEV